MASSPALSLARLRKLSLSLPSMPKNFKLSTFNFWSNDDSDLNGQEAAAMSSSRDLQDFLMEAQLGHYYNALRNELKITCVDHLKYVKEEDLESVGMAKPEMRRLKKFYKKECPQGTFGKLRKAITRGNSTAQNRPSSPSPPENRPVSYIRTPGKQIIPADCISINKTLGEGEFGVVQQGVWTTEDGDKVQVAIKCLSKERMQNGTQEFLQEAANMQTIDHENIVRMFGVVLDKDNSLMLVTELAPMRSLLECLKEPSRRLDFPIPRLCDFAQQICDGMSYLESKRLIHRDLAARNILVFSKHKVKVSDFGLSRALGIGKDYYQSNFSTSLKLPIAWCAPESINYLKFTSASDVWAFGVTLWEMFTYGFQPWSGLTGQQILDTIDKPQCQRLEKPDLCPKDYYDLMLTCWDHEPEDRPTFSQIFLKIPQMRPVQVKAQKDFPAVTLQKDYLYYKAYDVIIVLDTKPAAPPIPGLWKGVLNNGKCGWFDPTNTVPFIEPKTSPIALPKTSLVRKDSNVAESGRKSGRKIRADMISRPQQDLRHTGHIGYDGAVFGDVSFIGDNYDKLPLQVSSQASSMASIPRYGDSPERENGHKGTNGYAHSWMSQESLDSHAHNGRGTPPYQDINDDALFDFKIPDISEGFDFGPSFMDEVLRALDEKEKQLEASSDKSSGSPDKTLKDHSRSTSPDDRDSRPGPPPLPTTLPRTENKRDSRTEPKKQAKVKPMSASDQKMMEDAIAMANEFAAQSSRNQMMNDTCSSQSPPDTPKTDKNRIDFDSSLNDSGNIISKLKNSIKRSPKQERKRTFSDDIATKSDLSDEIPPEEQEAYNMLVVKGSKDFDSGTEDLKSSSPERSFNSTSSTEKSFSRVTPERPVIAARSTPDRSVNITQVRTTPDRSVSLNRTTPERSVSLNRTTPERSDIQPRTTPERFAVQPRSTPERSVSNITTATYSTITVDRTNNSNSVLRSSSEIPTRDIRPTPPKPMPKPRIDIKRPEIPPMHRSEIPVPKPRPEVNVNRVEPVPRFSVPSPECSPKDLKVEKKSSVILPSSPTESVKPYDREIVKKSIEIVRMDSPDDIVDKPSEEENSAEKDLSSEAESEPAEEKKESIINSLFNDDDIAEPTPREIMNKLARESRLRRTADHQRGVTGEELSAARKLREPQGIPVKSVPLATAEEDDEVDTNPLRMLRGGALPLRSSRGGAEQNNVTIMVEYNDGEEL
ncbi:activated Cdc42 kinase-like isoform X1 [Patella vulgata]|uniref:activated Cdc42 kinase-like isoform X1 n=2 Tax=Patella vulgata TaxID=6465 RepID=UPI00217F448B|nr:activated Cdc42 kinase-like isoform X1 [Patella vulgata]